jgi:drug/metabolite transporter (DMT)-like permease
MDNDSANRNSWRLAEITGPSLLLAVLAILGLALTLVFGNFQRRSFDALVLILAAGFILAVRYVIVRRR